MDYDQKRTQAAWQRYVGGSEAIPERIEGVRQEIVESWRRSKQSADPFAPLLPRLSEEDFSKAERENALLIQIAYPYLLDFYAHLRDAKHQFTLTDAQGCQLKRIAEEGPLSALAMEKQLRNGTLFSEAHSGTNGIGTCLALEKPVMVLGYEHYHSMYGSIACYAAPIYAPDRSLLGCINITGPLEAYQPLIMGMLGAAVSGIEREFQLTQTNRILHSTLESFDSAVLLLDTNKAVLHCNRLALEMFAAEGNDIVGQSIFSIIQESSLPPSCRSLEEEVTSLECTLLNSAQRPVYVSLTVKPRQDAHGLDTTLLLLNSQQYVHSLTNQLVGYSARYTFDSIIGPSPAVQTVKSLGAVAAEAPSPVLIFGENGTGKEIIAQAIHNASSRAEGPFIAVNCGAIPKSLLESELFGYEGGTFSGAKAGGHPGKFELADGGTLFLDEISNLSLELQASLLRVLQSKTITRLGGARAKAIDVKLITATNVNLLSAVQRRTFRDDLYYRLNTLSIVIPPLRERREDIAPLAEHFIEQYCNSRGRPPLSFDDESMLALRAYPWPGNVRELEDLMEHLLNEVELRPVALTDLPAELLNQYYTAQRSGSLANDAPQGEGATLREDEERAPTPEMQEYNTLIGALKRERGNVKQVAISLNLPASTLYRKLSKYHLNPKDYRAWP